MAAFLGGTAALILAILMFATPATADSLRCDITAKYACSAGGCEPRQLSTWNVIDPGSGLFSRCDLDGCDSYDAKITESGMFYTIEASGRGTIAKMARDGSSFLEVVTLGTVALVSFGSCQSH